MSPSPVRVLPADDTARFVATDKIVWFDEEGSLDAETEASGVPPRLRFAAETEDTAPSTYAGIYGVRPMTLSVPGTGEDGDRVRQAPAAGLTWVGVHPDHRRRGVLTRMLQHHFRQTREEEPGHVSVLHASEQGIYGRHGYGMASLELTLHLGRGTTFTAPHLEDEVAGLRTRIVDLRDDGVPERLRACELRVAAGNLGAVVGEPEFYRSICRESPEELRDKEPGRALFASRDGVDVGVALLRRTGRWERGRSVSEVTVFGLLGQTAARLALLRRLVDLDLVGTAKVFGIGAEDPVLHWIGGPRGAADLVSHDSLWVRLVDLPAALAQRGYAADCDVVVEVADPAAEWNEGRWRIRVTDGAAEVTRTDAAAHVSLPTQALGAAYLGGGNLLTQLRAGLLEEHRPGATRELWRALRTDELPGTAIGF